MPIAGAFPSVPVCKHYKGMIVIFEGKWWLLYRQERLKRRRLEI